MTGDWRQDLKKDYIVLGYRTYLSLFPLSITSHIPNLTLLLPLRSQSPPVMSPEFSVKHSGISWTSSTPIASWDNHTWKALNDSSFSWSYSWIVAGEQMNLTYFNGKNLRILFISFSFQDSWSCLVLNLFLAWIFFLFSVSNVCYYFSY